MMKTHMVQSGYFEHTRTAQLARASNDPKLKPWIAPRVALDVLLLPMNLALGTRTIEFHDDMAPKLYHTLQGQAFKPVQLGAWGLVNKGFSKVLEKSFFAVGIAAGALASPVGLLAGQTCRGTIKKAGAWGAQVGLWIGFIPALISESLRAGTRWTCTNPHKALLVACVVIVFIGLLLLVGKAFEGRGGDSFFAGLMVSNATRDLGPAVGQTVTAIVTDGSATQDATVFAPGSESIKQADPQGVKALEDAS